MSREKQSFRLKLPRVRRSDFEAFNVRMEPSVMQWWVDHVAKSGLKSRGAWMRDFMEKVENEKKPC